MPFLTAADGTRLAFTSEGSGEPLLCLPGGPGRAGAYLEDLGGLTAERTLVVLDPRATGRSEVPADPATLRFDRLAEDVEALREHLGLERACVLGHSAGTVVAQAWASAHPDRVASLVLVTPTSVLQGGTRADVAGIRAQRSGEPWYPEAAEAAEALEAGLTGSQAQAAMRAYRPFYYGRWDARQQEHAATADRQMSRRAELGFRGEPGDVDVPALVAGLRSVTAPVLVLGAEHDAATGLTAVEEVAACFPAARTQVLPGAGHFPWVDEPEAFRAAVLAGLRTAPDTAGTAGDRPVP